MEEEQSPPRSLFKSNVNERCNITQEAVDGWEERAKEDNGVPWRRPATVGLGDNERMLRLVPKSVIMAQSVLLLIDLFINSGLRPIS